MKKVAKVYEGLTRSKILRKAEGSGRLRLKGFGVQRFRVRFGLLLEDFFHAPKLRCGEMGLRH